MLRRLSRLPIRLRLTLAFATAMAVAFSALGVFIYVEFEKDQAATLDEGLRARLADLVNSQGPPGELAQVGAEGTRLLTPGERAEVLRGGTLTVERRRVEGAGDVRIRATRAGPREVAAVAEPLRTPDSELSRLRTLLLVAGPLALLAASFAGYEVAGAALRPVERMRARAASIEAGDVGERLPVGPADDEVGRLGHTLNELLDRLEDALARERRVVSDASHELRTPLTLLRTELQLALRGERSPAELRTALTGALGETERMTRLADDLLVLARADQGRLPLRRAALDVRELLDDRVARVAPGASVVVPDGLAIDADPDRAAQAVDNLLTNALRHGGGTVELHARVGADGLVELHVLDRGPGFGGDASRAFERFHGGGTGLGLSIVAAIAGAHGGSAGAANRPEGGADAWIALPAAQPVAGAAHRLER